MKTRTLPAWALALALPGLPVGGGCTEEASGVTNQTHTASPLAAAATAPGPTNAVPAQTNLTAGAPALNAAPPDLAMQGQPPAHVIISSSLKEVVKMAQAGIDEAVMLSFVTNSAGTFNLGSDQIIYLNDLGLPSQVVTAMIQHDQELSSGAGMLGASTVPSPLPLAPEAPPVTPPATASASAPSLPSAEAASGAPQYAPSAAPAPPESAPPPTVVNNNYFYDSLSPYGNWVNVDGYGWCWQPTATVINAGWRPYGDGGRWLYTDSGWYWASDYTWGGIAFHYGRWFSDPRWGWCWWPDTCWGPSWVTWRYGGGYCGWAPLPPCTYWSPGVGFSYYGGPVGLSFGFGLGYSSYAFVPWGHFYDAHPYRYALAGNQGVQIYQNSTVVNNYINGNNNTIINDGVGRAKAAQFSRSEIRTVAVRDVPLAPGRALRADRVARENGKLVVYRPLAPVPSPSAAHPGTPAPVAGVGRVAGAREELASGSRPSALRSGPGPAQNASPAPLGAAARKAASFPVRASVPVALTDPISRPQPIRMAPNTLEVQMTSRPGSPVTNSRQEPTGKTRAGATTVWQNDAQSSVYRRQLAPANDVASAAPAQMAPTFDRQTLPARSAPEADRFYRRDLSAGSLTAPERPYQPAVSAPSAPAPPRFYAPPPRAESYSAPPARSTYSPPPAASAPPPRPSPSAPAPSGGRSGRNQSN